MSPNITYNIEVRSDGDELPPGIENLLGHEVLDLFEADDSNAVIVGAVTDGRWIAGLLLLIEDASGKTVGSIRQLIIPPAQRGRGIAGRLIRQALAIAGERGAVRLRSTAGWGCPDHLALYRRMKFGRTANDEAPYLVTRTV